MNAPFTLALIDVQRAIHFFMRRRDRSKYGAGLVHQISLSNLEGGYASINATDEIIQALGN